MHSTCTFARHIRSLHRPDANRCRDHVKYENRLKTANAMPQNYANRKSHQHHGCSDDARSIVVVFGAL